MPKIEQTKEELIASTTHEELAELYLESQEINYKLLDILRELKQRKQPAKLKGIEPCSYSLDESAKH